jgi:diguanylate cyclase (GGDEF)-like protein
LNKIKELTSLLNHFKRYTDQTKRKNYLFQQGIYATLYSSFALMLIFFIVFALHIDTQGLIKYFYMIISILMMLQLILTAYIIKNQKRDMLSSSILIFYPIVVVTIGALNFYLGNDFLTERLSFFIIMFITTLITFNSILYSLVLYIYALILFNITVYVKFGYDSSFYVPLLLYIVFCAIVNILFNFLSYRLIFAESQVDLIDEKQKETIKKLEESNYELEYTQKIAHMMMEITTDVITNDDIYTLLETIIKKAVEVMPNATAGSILLKKGNDVNFVSAFGYDIEKLRQIKMSYRETFQHKLGNISNPEIIQNTRAFNELRTSIEFVNQFKDLGIPSSKSVITCPIILANDVYGSINLDNLENECAFSDKDKPIVLYLAKQIGLALKNHELLNKTLHYTRHDLLTNAYLRMHHEELLKKVYENARLYNHCFSIVIIDINHLKKINDTFGHQAGDQLLKFFTDQSKKFLSDYHYLSRTGGDEFTILLDLTNAFEAKEMIRKMKKFFSENPLEIDDTSIHIEFGAGISSYPEDGDLPNILSNIADKRMYEDKNKQKLNL